MHVTMTAGQSESGCLHDSEAGWIERRTRARLVALGDAWGTGGPGEHHYLMPGAGQAGDQGAGEHRGAACRWSKLVGSHQHSHRSSPPLSSGLEEDPFEGGAPRKMSMRRAQKKPITRGIQTVSMR